MSALTYKRVVLVGSWDETRIYRELLPDFQELQLQAVVGGGEASALLGAPRVYGSVDELLRRGCVPHLALICSASCDPRAGIYRICRILLNVVARNWPNRPCSCVVKANRSKINLGLINSKRNSFSSNNNLSMPKRNSTQRFPCS